MPVVHIDIESFSEINLPKVGVYRYAENPSTEILVVCYAFDEEPVNTWVPELDLPTEVVTAMEQSHAVHGGKFTFGAQVPSRLVKHMRGKGQLRAHHAEFERVMLNGLPGQRLGFPTTSIRQWVCTAAKVAAHGLPRALANAAEALQAEHQKSAAGRMVMLQLCKPRQHKDFDRWTPDNAPDKFIGLYQYCADDVRTERSIDKRVPDLPPAEQEVWYLDQAINERGVQLDRAAIHDVLFLVNQYKKLLWDRCVELTGYTPSQTAQVADWIRDQGVNIENLQAPTVDRWLKQEGVPRRILEVLKIRRLHEMKAVSKYDAMLRAMCSDDRLRGMFMYYGAGTGRWSGVIVQLQNLYRGDLEDPDGAVDAFRERDLDWLRVLYDQNPMKLFASTVRSMIVAPPGKRLLCMDYAAIEGRVLAWLADEEEKLQIYRTHGKVYEHIAARMFGLDTSLPALLAMKDDHPRERFLGKTAELACGYQGAKAAFQKMAKNYNVDIPTHVAEEVVRDWRQLNQNTVRFWYSMENAACAAVADPTRTFQVGRIQFKRQGSCLYMRLPSGRRLVYYRPHLEDGGRLTYLGINTYTRQWGRVDSYGGRLVENCTQAIARDVLVHGMQSLTQAGYQIVAHVHDEVIIEDDRDDLEGAIALLCQLPDWAEGLPVKAEGFIADRYRKD